MVDLCSFFPRFHFLFFVFFGWGVSWVLSHGTDFLAYVEDIYVDLDIGTLCCTWLGDGAT